MNAKPYSIELTSTRRQRHVWVAKITGLDTTYRFKREFLEPDSIEWGKNRMKSAEFLLEEGIYHDSDGDYYRIKDGEGGLEFIETCPAEIQYTLEKELPLI